MFEINVHVVLGENRERNRKYAEIYCENDTEMKTIDTSQYVVGTRCITVTANFKEYRLSKTQGKWYDRAVVQRRVSARIWGQLPNAYIRQPQPEILMRYWCSY